MWNRKAPGAAGGTSDTVSAAGVCNHVARRLQRNACMVMLYVASVVMETSLHLELSLSLSKEAGRRRQARHSGHVGAAAKTLQGSASKVPSAALTMASGA